MTPKEIEQASVTELLARYTKVRLDMNRFDKLADKAKHEKEKIFDELYRERNLRSGLYVMDGRKVVISTNNGIGVSTPTFRDIDKHTRRNR